MRTPVNEPGPTPAAIPSSCDRPTLSSPSTASIRDRICSACPRAVESPRSSVPRSVRSAMLNASVEVSIASTRMAGRPRLAGGGGRCALAAQALRQKCRAGGAVLEKRTRRQRLEKDLPISLRRQARIAEHDHAEIVEIADQASDTLFQSEHG